METKIYHNQIDVVRIELNNGRAFVFRTVRDSSGNPHVMLLKFDNGPVPEDEIMLADYPGDPLQGFLAIKEITIMDDQDMDTIHYNNAAKPKLEQLPLFSNELKDG